MLILIPLKVSRIIKFYLCLCNGLVKYNKAIEFQGDYWHMNPTIFEADDFNEIKNKTAFEIWKYDLNKFELSKAKHIDIFYIWESDWNLNKEKIKLKVLDFLKQL